jgi:exonuclease SbcC
MIPINLTISGFLSYRDPVEIDFTSFNLACIAGANGAGKSSILDAITWVLFGQARKRDDSVINTQSETAEVALVFEYEGNLFRILRANPRGKTTLLEFHIAQTNVDSDPLVDGKLPTTNQQLQTTNWKPLTEHTLRETQTRIEETLRLDYDTFVNAAFFLQGKADQFTQQRPGDRKRILASILGLDVWEAYRQRAVERRKIIEAEMTTLDGRLEEINAELTEEDARKARLSELETELNRLAQSRKSQETVLENIKRIAATLAEQRKLVDNLARQLDSAQQRMHDLDLRLAARQEEKESHTKLLSRQSEIETAYQSWQETRETLARWDEIAEQFRDHEKRRQGPLTTLETARARLLQELENLEEQQLAVSGKQSMASDLKSQVEVLHTQITDLQSQITHRKSLEAELTAAQEVFANARAENPRLKDQMDELKDRINQLTETDGAACPLCGQPLSPEERQNLIDQLQTLGTEMGDKFRANKKLLTEIEEKVTDLKLKVESLAHLDDELLNKKDQLNKLENRLQQIEADQQTWESEGALRLAEITSNLQLSTFSPEARAELAEIDAELKAIGYDTAEHDKIRQAERQGRAADGEYHQLEIARATLEPLDREIETLNVECSTLENQLTTQQQEHNTAVTALAAAEVQAPDLDQAQRELLDIQEQENRLRMEVGAAQQKVLVLGDLKTRRKSLEAEREKFAQQVGQFKQLERAFGKDGVPALLIEQALPQIETKANEILDRLSGGNMSVRFLTQREYKDKKRDDLRETLDIAISDSAGIRDYEMFSGGEAFRVNFAIRLALSEVLAQRAGARLQTLVIDEGFGSQDEIGRQRLIEAINTVKADFAKILVITHIDSLKDVFPTRLEVEKTSRGSVVSII